MIRKLIFLPLFLFFLSITNGCYLINHWGEEYGSSSSKNQGASSSSSSSSSSPDAITAFGFTSALNSGAGINNDVIGVISGNNINLTVPYGSVVTALKATFSITGVKVEAGSALRVSGVTANDFTNPVIYTVTAADGSTKNYTVTVTIALVTAKEITAFSFTSALNSGALVNSDITGIVNEAAKTITVTAPFYTILTGLKATYSTTGVKVQVGGAVQTSAVTANNFTSPVVYTVTAGGGSTQNYTVTVTKAALTETGITASDGAGSDAFGYNLSLSADGNTLAIGAYGKNSFQGKAYIYKRSGSAWIETGITASDGAGFDDFGNSVSLSQDGNTLAIGADRKNGNRGKAYIYKWNGSAWVENGITASDRASNDFFGNSVGLSQDGNTLAIGAYKKNSGQGKAYIYNWNGSAWVETGITASDGAANDFFGYSVGLSGDGNTLSVGADGKNGNQGKAYIYNWNGSAWVENGITASDGAANDFFGYSVGLSQDGNTLAIGAYGKNNFQGKAYIYKWNGSAWVENGISASDGAANDDFGSSVGLSGDRNTLSVGAFGKNSSQGKAYIYKWNGSAWVENGITASDGAANDNFGYSVSLSGDGNTLYAGAYGKNGNQGKAYIYK